MRHLVVLAAGLGQEILEWNDLPEVAGMSFQPAESVFPAVTCTAQATFRTASQPREHGMVSNGIYSRELHKVMFWEQSADLVRGARIWDGARAAGQRVGMYFWQQSLGESVDSVISPAPIHKHGGGMVMSNYTMPTGMDDILDRLCGRFPLHRYWGPLASPIVGRAVLANFTAMVDAHEPDLAFLYLPTLDYAAQRRGPDSSASRRALQEFVLQINTLADFTARKGADMTVCGDYAIGHVDLPPSFPNITLRKAGLFSVRPVGSRTYPDFHASRAFAMCDHEVAHVYVRNIEDVEIVERLFASTGEYEMCERREGQEWAHPAAGELLLLARKGSWCAYPWWMDKREAPDYATHIDIHNKPGYDPCELFFGRIFPPSTSLDAGRVKGTHGRTSTIAWASTDRRVGGRTFMEIASSLPLRCPAEVNVKKTGDT